MTAAASPELDERVDEQLDGRAVRAWQTVVWNDPVNLMSYVVYVFRTHFGYSREKATTLMLHVHEDGQAVVAEGAREQMELHARAMHDYGLWATVRKVGG
ncbi:MAG TPA: ATP-dependent Clp protease adapter ClpS [Microbacterium sp.]|nr:ATP-dependent Clp protease adapter ClpS [Microbacterium sp.]